MFTLKSFLVFSLIFLNCIGIIGILYPISIVLKNYEYFTLFDLLSTSVTNCGILFFAIASILAAVHLNIDLLLICLFFTIIELSRSIHSCCTTWLDSDQFYSDNIEKAFVTFDTGMFL
jgi:hypothetical protein